MEFGIIKSKIDKKLSESYINGTFSEEIKKFKKNVIDNPEISKAYYLYDELSKQKGLDKQFAEDYLSECIDLYKTIEFSSKKINLLESWLKNVKTANNYENVDIVLAKKSFIVEDILNSKKEIVSLLTSKKESHDSVNIPLEKIIEVANNSIKNFVSDLSESDQKDLRKYLTLSESELNKRYEVISEMVLDKLEKIKIDSDETTVPKINETISKIKSDKVDAVSLLKLKNLNENL